MIGHWSLICVPCAVHDPTGTCIQTYLYAYTALYTIHAYKHIYMHTQPSTPYIHTNIFICIHSPLHHTYIHTNIFICIHSPLHHTYIHTNIFICIHRSTTIHTYIQTYVYAYTALYNHTYTALYTIPRFKLTVLPSVSPTSPSCLTVAATHSRTLLFWHCKGQAASVWRKRRQYGASGVRMGQAASGWVEGRMWWPLQSTAVLQEHCVVYCRSTVWYTAGALCSILQEHCVVYCRSTV
jgi:hypothetical protein